MTLKIVRNDITRINAEAIVCPSNRRLLEGSGTSYRIYKAAGEALLNKACEQIGSCEYTKNVVTSGFNLSKYIIHVVGPVYDIGSEQEERDLSKTYENALQTAKKYNIKSIAVPLLSSGNYGFPKNLSLQIALDTANRFLLKHDMDIQIVVYDQESTDFAKRIMPVEEFINEQYVEDTNEDFADEEFIRRFRRNNTRIRPKLSNSRFMKEMDTLVEEELSVMNEPELSVSYEKVTTTHPAPFFKESSRSLSDLVSQKSETFADMLLRLIDQRDMSDSEVYTKANVSKQHFNKIKNVPGYTPRKPTIYSLAMVLRLSLDETIDLLAKAGQAFSDCSKTDIIVRYYFENKIYDLQNLNETLNSYHLDALCLKL